MNSIEERINALACAVAVMEGTAGGYSPEEKARHKQTLIKFLKDLEDNYLQELQKD